MAGPRLLTGSQNEGTAIDSSEVRWEYFYTTSDSGSAGQTVCIDTGTTTYGYRHVKAADSDDGNQGLAVGVALDDWTAASAKIRVAYAGTLSGVTVLATVAAKDLLVVSATAGSLQDRDDAVAGDTQGNIQDALGYVVVGIALTAASSLAATVRLLNPMRIGEGGAYAAGGVAAVGTI